MKKTVKSTIREMQRGHAPREKFDHLRVTLHDTIDAPDGDNLRLEGYGDGRREANRRR